MINLRSDNESKVFSEILNYINKINNTASKAYGEDAITEKAKSLLCDFFEIEVKVFFLVSGTAANSICLATICPPFGSILCSEDAHINLDECGAPEFFSGGAKLIPIKTSNGLLSIENITAKINSMGSHGVHEMLPSAISITQTSELGTVYQLEHIRNISKIAKKNKLKLHMDGARFANACAFLKCTPSEMTWKSGIDILSLGATKNGALSCELVVVFNKSLYANVDRRQKRAGHLLSKQKFIAAQIIKWIENDKWIKAASKANNFAKKIENILKNNNKINIIYPIESNMIFLELSLESELNLKKNNVEFYNWPSNNNTLRFVTSWNFKNQEINILKNIFNN